MLHEKILIKTIDLIDAKDIYAQNMEEVFARHLKKYENRCSDGMFITKVVRILNYGPVQMSTNLNNGLAQCDVRFLVEGIVLIPKEILHGCKIIEIHNNVIIASNKYAGIKIEHDEKQIINKILQVGQEIPVVIERACYTINQPNISAIAKPYVPVPDKHVIYAVNGTYQFTDDEKERLEYLFNTIEKGETLLQQLNKEKQFEFFRNIMFPYSSKKYEPNKLDVQIIIDKDLVKNLSKHMRDNNALYLYYPPTDDRMNKRFFLLDKQNNLTKTGEVRVLKTNLYSTVYHICSVYCMYLQSLNEFINTYKSVESVKKLTQYWSICLEKKKLNDRE